MSDNSITLKEALNYLQCPDCASDFEIVEEGSEKGYICRKCDSVFPSFEGIPIILDKASRNAELEVPLLRSLMNATGAEDMRRVIEGTINELTSKAGATAYAWEDEVHWSEVYGHQLEEGKQKNWNDRFWQRKPVFRVVREYLEKKPAAGERVIIDLGCGEGQDFRRFLSDQVNNDDLYVGLDISLPGLLLNRKENPHARNLYVLASADKPPLRKNIATILISLGTLHHMEAKADGLSVLDELLGGGLIVLSDPINGQFLPDFLRFSRASRSAHDDSLDVNKLKGLIAGKQLTIRYERQISGLVYFLLFRVLRPIAINNRTLHRAIHGIDDLSAFLLGRWISLFRPRGLLMVLEKS